MKPRRPASRGLPDRNHAAVIGWYRQLMCSVYDSHELGIGFPDLVIGCAGRTELVEVKSDDGELLPSQVLFANGWRGSRVAVVRTLDDVAAHVEDVRRRARQDRFTARLPP